MMLKALFKKQMSELNSAFYQNRKTGKNRSKSGAVAYIIFYVFICIFLAGIFYVLGDKICAPLVKLDMGWFYFTIMTAIGLMLGVFGSVFNTYATLYSAKDNELLLSLPIPPSKILITRLFGVWYWGTIYELIVLIPSLIVYWRVSGVTVLKILSGIFSTVSLSFLILTLSCLLGWIVAKITAKIKSKSFITVVISLLFFGAYYYCYSRAYSMIQKLIANAEVIGGKIKGAAYPLYLMGKASGGDILSTLIFVAFTAAVFAAVYYILARSFLSLSTVGGTSSVGGKRKISFSAKSPKSALLQKEGRRFASSAVYMLNCGLGTLFLVVAAAAIVIKGGVIRNFVSMVFANDLGPVALICTAAVCLMTTMNDITAPSVSLEGRNIWILQSLPVSARDVLLSKLKLHLYITAVPVVLCSAAICAVLKLGALLSVAVIANSLLFLLFEAAFGLMINLKMPNLNWTNETAAVKQGLGVAIAMFNGWVLIGILGAAFALLHKSVSATVFIFAVTAFLTLLSLSVLSWLCGKGAKIFEEL